MSARQWGTACPADRAAAHVEICWRAAQACSLAKGSFDVRPQPAIGEWYRQHGEQLFEVVAVDEDSGTIEVQYFDGTVEEMEFDDWKEQWKAGALEAAEAPRTGRLGRRRRRGRRSKTLARQPRHRPAHERRQPRGPRPVRVMRRVPRGARARPA
ncbi:MAG: DUF6763 family protein [Steroidobacteraceae bacterium]